MQQLEIQYFFPLTEQIPLDLDFTPSKEYETKLWEERAKSSVSITAGTGLVFASTGVGASWVSINHDLGNPSFTINVDQCPITIQSKKKPNIFRRYIYKILGMKWKAE